MPPRKKTSEFTAVDILNRVESLHDGLKDELTGIRRDIHGIHTVQIKQQVILEEHIKRTKNNEDHLDLLREQHDKDVEPLQQHVAMWSGASKALLTIAALLGAIYTAYKLLVP